MSWKRAASSLAGQLVYGTGLHRVLLGDRAVVVVFHRVDDRYPRDPITISRRTFKDYCEFFARHFRVCSLAELLGRLHREADLSRCLAITFDDGYLDNYTVAAPILESCGLRATFFVTTGFIGSPMVPWWDRKQGIDSEWMTWEQVADLRARGHEVGAHTVSHPDLGVVEGDPARREIVESRRELEQRLGTAVEMFAYPYGRVNGISDANRGLVREAGYSCCAGAYGGLVQARQDPFELCRIPVSAWYGSPHDFGLSVLRSH